MIKVEKNDAAEFYYVFFVVEISTTQDSVAKLNLQMVISPIQTLWGFIEYPS